MGDPPPGEPGDPGATEDGNNHDPEREVGDQPRSKEQDVESNATPPNTTEAACPTAVSKEAPPVTPQRKFELLISTLPDSSPSQPLEAEVQLVSKLLTDALKRNELDISAVATHNKRITKAEQLRLLRLCRLIISSSTQKYAEWEVALDSVLLLVLQTKWKLKHALENIIAKLSIKNTPTLQEWVNVVGRGDTKDKVVTASPESTIQETFMLNPAKYNSEMHKRLLTVCHQRYSSGSEYNEGTEDEWRVVERIASGNILCRTVPPAVSRLLGAEGSFELQLMVQTHIEGELHMKLLDHEQLREAQRTTASVLEMIGTAAVARQQPNPDLYRMLTAVKTVHYDSGSHGIVFTFFTRIAAARYAHVRVPFGHHMHSLRNAHEIKSANIGTSLSGMTKTRTYQVRVRNLNRGMDLARFYKWMKAKLPFGFEMVDLDSYTKYSRLSNTWELRFPISHCPDYLRGKNRIIWLGEVLIIEHPRTNRRKQCLACGDTGHLARQCKQTDETLRGDDAIVVSDDDIVALGAPPPIYQSYQELKASIKARHASAGEVKSASKTQRDPASENITNTQEEVQPRQMAPTEKVERLRQRVQRQEKQERALESKRQRSAIRDTKKRSSKQASKAWPSGSEVIDLVDDDDESSSSEEEEKEASGPLPPQTTRMVQMLADIDQTRATAQHRIGKHGKTKAHALGMNPLRAGNAVTTFTEVECCLGMIEQETPMTGNCQVFAVAQALLETAYNEQPTKVIAVASTLKRGIQQAAKLDITKDFTYEAKQAILGRANMDKGLTKGNSSQRLAQWLDAFAESPTDNTSLIPEELWGGNDTIRMMAKFLQRDIFVLAQEQSKWNCTWHQCQTENTSGITFLTAKERPIEIGAFLTTVGRAKVDALENGHEMPIVLRFRPRHYTSYSHYDVEPREFKQESRESESKTEIDGGDVRMKTNPKRTLQRRISSGNDQNVHMTTPKEISNDSHDNTLGRRGEEELQEEVSHENVSQEHRRSLDWDNNTQSMWRKLYEESTTSQDLAPEIKGILEQGGIGLSELMQFLISKANQVTKEERVWLHHSDFDRTSEVTNFMQKYQLSDEGFQNWRAEIIQKETSFMGLPAIGASRGSMNNSEPTQIPATSIQAAGFEAKAQTPPPRPKPGKRSHDPTPMVKRHMLGTVVNARNARVPLKKNPE